MTDEQRADAVAAMGAFKRDKFDDTFDQDRMSELVVAGLITKEDIQAILREASDVDIDSKDRTYMNQMLDHIKRRESKQEVAEEAQIDMAQHATTSTPGGSLFVYDKHVEKAIYGLMQGAIAQTQLLAAYGSGSGDGGGTTVNNVTVSPSTSNTVSSVQKSENTYGTVDPYTSAAGAYG